MSASQLTWIPTGWWNSTMPFQSAPEALAGYGQVASSTVFTAAPLTTDIDESFEELSEKITGDNSYTFFKHSWLGNNYGLSTKHAIYDITFLNQCTKKPNYASPLDNLATSMTLLRGYKRSVNAFTLVEHLIAYLGCRAESVTLAIDASGKINLDIGWSVRQIKGPVAGPIGTGTPLGWTTPTTVADFSAFGAQPLSHVDAGQLSFTYNAVPYVMESFSISWTNTLLNERYPGSLYLDTSELSKQEIKVNVVIVEGKDLVFTGEMTDADMSILSGTQKIKAAATSITLNMTEMKMDTLSRSQSSSSGEKFKESIAFDVKSTAFV